MGTDINAVIRVILRYAREIEAYTKNSSYRCDFWESIGFRLCSYSLIRLTIPFQEKETELMLRNSFPGIDWKAIRHTRNACAHRTKSSFNLSQYRLILHVEIPNVIQTLSAYINSQNFDRASESKVESASDTKSSRTHHFG